MNKELISIIIPVYNGERYLGKCLDSILNQTYKNLEIIIINDGSTDSTQSVIDFYKKKHNFIYDYYQENSGQGIARNKGLKYAKGEFVSFIDADDIIHEKFIESLYNSIRKYNSDFAICDWIYYYNNSKTKYKNKNEFMSYTLLENRDTELVLSADVYFTVNKLYRKQFLVKNKIKYGEGYIYEDIEFYINSCVLANKISIIHNPYYYVRVNQHSTTKTNYNSMLHYDSFLKAIAVSLKDIKMTSKYGFYYVYRYFLDRSYVYYNNRMPSKKIGKEFLSKVFMILNEYINKSIKIPIKERKRNIIIFKRILPNNNVLGFIYINKLTRNKKIRRLKKSINKNVLRNFNKFIKLKYYNIQLRMPFYKDIVLFYGFDNRYVGNSKYLYKYLINENNQKKLYFVTTSDEVKIKNKVIPNSFKFWRLLARSENLIFESWVPLNFIKRNGANWIQLWHGTPIKKMLFDSSEIFISSNNPKHKLNKYKDINRWDYLICENLNNKIYFAESFLLDKTKILAYGYPRVKYLVDNINNNNKIVEIKKMLNIPNNKKVIFYAPTWRDYNYEKQKQDSNYLLQLQKLKEKLPKDYIVVIKNHPFLNPNLKMDDVINISREIETQDVLLVTDILISDYSSIIFDYIAIDKPIILYANDIEKYEECRGIYSNVWNDLEFAICTNLKQVVDKIKLIKSGKYPQDKILFIKTKYCCHNVKYCYNNISKLLK